MSRYVLQHGGRRARWSAALAGVFLLILVPFFLFENSLSAAAVETIEALRGHSLLSGAVIVGLLAADVLLPVPSSLVSALAGAALGFWGGVAAIWLGMSAGCLVGYWFGASAGRLALRRVVGEAELDRARDRLIGAGGIALMLTRAVPVLAETMVLGAGAARMNLVAFCCLTFPANFAVAFAYAAVGALALSEGSFFLFFFGLCALPAIGWLLWTRYGT